MKCKKYRAQIFDYQDGKLSPQAEDELNVHLAECPRCRAEKENEENLARGLRESYRAATASFSFDPDKSKFDREEDSLVSSVRANAIVSTVGKHRVFRWLVAGIGAVILLAAVLFGPFKPRKRDSFLANRMIDVSLSIHDDDLPDPFRDWIEGRMIITIEDKEAGTTEKYLADRTGAIRKIAVLRRGR